MDELARLKWQCRRGTKELDFLLNRYLESGYLAADQAERNLFVELLGLEDDQLVGVLMGDLEVEGMEVLVGKVRALLVSQPMILEVALLQVRPGQSAAFESAFHTAQSIIASMPGYVSHELQRCVEREGEYILLVRWQTLKDHEVGFRQSPQYQEWRKLLHHFYDPFPTVLHYEQVPGAIG